MESAFMVLVGRIRDDESDNGRKDVGWRDEEERVDFAVLEGGDEGRDEGGYGAGGGFGYYD